MKIDIITIFPDIIESYISHSIIKRAIVDHKINVNIINLRHYSDLKHNQVDDTVYGGGAGMLLMFPPFYRAIKEIKQENTKVIMTSPKGKILTQEVAKSLAKLDHIIILCGHYEGIDHRVSEFVDEKISIGDFILTGGELPALVLLDSIARLVPGVISDQSHVDESFQDDLLEYPQYTKPQEFAGFKVPEVLLTGHHENIKKWRRYMALKETYDKRPELLDKVKLTEEDKEFLKKIKQEKNPD